MLRIAASAARAVVMVANLVAVAPGSFASGSAGERGPGPRLDIEAPPGLARQAAAVRAIEDEDWSPLLSLVGLDAPGSAIRVVLAGEHSPQAAHVPDWVSGYAQPALDTIVLFPGRVPSYPDRNLEALLRHEIAHMMIARASGNGRLPRWFDEGVATVAAREWGVEDSARVVLATLGPGPRSLSGLDAAFFRDGASVSRAYAVSAAVVRSLLREHGDDAVARTLAGMARGASFDDAFRAAIGENPEAFGRAYFRSEVVWRTWVPFLTSSTALWMAITALALWAIKRRRERDAAQRESWAVEESHVIGGKPPDPPAEGGPRTWN